MMATKEEQDNVSDYAEYLNICIGVFVCLYISMYLYIVLLDHQT